MRGIKFIENYFGYYYLLFLFSYLSIYFAPAITPVLNVLILGFSYHLIIRWHRFDVIILLILYARCLNGFIIMHSKTAYMIINMLANVVPILLYFTAILYTKKTHVNSHAVYKHKFTLLFFIFLTISFILNFSTSYDLLSKRYLPFAFFIGFLFFSKPENFNVLSIIKFFRATFVATLFIYFFSDYINLTQSLIESDSVFSVASPPNSYSLIYMALSRNMGIFWDHRILAIAAYLFLFLSLVYKPSNFKLDILISLIIVITTTSRGGMVAFALILVAYLFQVYRFKLIAVFAMFAIVLSGLFYFADKLFSPTTVEFIQSFSPQSKYNAISQRKSFSDYALKEFVHHPIFGNGVGYLSSHTIKRDLVVDGVQIPAVGDAYWYVLLAEMGILGFILYLLFLFEVFFSTKLINVALLLGFAVQLLGTDIPDMRFYYFAILVMVYLANLKLKEDSVRKPNLSYEN